MLCDGAAGSECAPWKWRRRPDSNGRLDFVSFSTQAPVIWFGKSETTQLLRMCVFMVCESQGGRVRGRQSRLYLGNVQYRDNFCDIKVSICLFFPAQRRSSFIPFCDLLSLWSCHTGQDPSKLTKKASPVCQLHSKVLTTDAPYPPFWQHSVECLLLARGGRGGHECHAAVIALEPA